MNEEALASHVTGAKRKLHGVFFTPSALVNRVLDAVAPWVPPDKALRIIDPACGAGAFLSAAAFRWPQAEVIGVELDPISAATCLARVPHAKVSIADALTATPWPVPDERFELWVGNPPYNGTSPLLKSKEAWAAACALLPEHLRLPKGISLREDFVFFLLMASRRLEHQPGALAFITSATLLDTYAYASVRQALLERMQLREVIELEAGTFEGTKVVPCVTVWTSPRVVHQFAEPAMRVKVGTKYFSPRGPDWRLRRLTDEAQALDARWSSGELLTSLIPVSFAGLKTRFDELLVADDRHVLAERVASFINTKDVNDFAHAFGLQAFVSKLAHLKQYATKAVFDPAYLRPFLRYRGPNPRGASGWCYLDRHLIPRGDHRLRGHFNPHDSTLKLAFNLHELPLAAAVIDEPGCVTMYRHSRFAPESVPRALLLSPAATHFDVDDVVPNLSPRGHSFGSARAVFDHVARHFMSAEFQNVWAPAFGKAKVPLIPL